MTNFSRMVTTCALIFSGSWALASDGFPKGCRIDLHVPRMDIALYRDTDQTEAKADVRVVIGAWEIKVFGGSVDQEQTIAQFSIKPSGISANNIALVREATLPMVTEQSTGSVSLESYTLTTSPLKGTNGGWIAESGVLKSSNSEFELSDIKVTTECFR